MKSKPFLFRLSVDIFREFLIKSDFERGLLFVKQNLKNDRMINICIALANKLNQNVVAKKLKDILDVINK
jgi:hypothetical protein